MADEIEHLYIECPVCGEENDTIILPTSEPMPSAFARTHIECLDTLMVQQASVAGKFLQKEN